MNPFDEVGDLDVVDADAYAELLDENAKLTAQLDEALEEVAARKARAKELRRDRDRQAEKKQRVWEESGYRGELLRAWLSDAEPSIHLHGQAEDDPDGTFCNECGGEIPCYVVRTAELFAPPEDAK